MQVWLRRDDKNQLWLYTEKPDYDTNIKTYFPALKSKMSRINSHLFEEIPMDSKPIEYSIKQVIQPANNVERHS
jgi:hypothetical protein